MEDVMIRNGEEILADIDVTLDQLIRNAETIRHISIRTLNENEMEAMQKTQESLLARVLHMNDLLGAKEKKVQFKKHADTFGNIQQKIERFGKLNIKLIDNVAGKFKTKPRIGKNRKKQKAG